MKKESDETKFSDCRLIEDFLPVNSLERENTTRKGHINTLHLWWARRPLVPVRATVFAALTSADFAKPANGPAEKRGSLARANAAKFIERLCAYPASSHEISEARRFIYESHARRLSAEINEAIAAEDITEGKRPLPKVLDMFAGGGSIPLESLRLGCEVFAFDLNPVAHIVQLCTLVFPQRYGKPDSKILGMTGEKNAKGVSTWGGLAEEVRYWGEAVFKRVRNSIGDLYPLVPDPDHKKTSETGPTLFGGGFEEGVPRGFLVPVAYLWTRTAPCKNPHCGATIPLLRQTWLCKRNGKYVATRMTPDKKLKIVRFSVETATSEVGLGFNPDTGIRGSNAACPFCGAAADAEYLKQIAASVGFGTQPMAIMCVRPGNSGKRYVAFEDKGIEAASLKRLAELSAKEEIAPLDEPLEANPRSFDVQRYGFTKWEQVFTARQRLMLMTISTELKKAHAEIMEVLRDEDLVRATYTCVALSFSRLVTQHNAFSMVHSGRETIEGPWGDAKFPMSWDFAEANPFSGVTASYQSALNWAVKAYEHNANLGKPAEVRRGSATKLPLEDNSIDAVITDPPYYDSVSYSNLSDAFYIWLKRSIGFLYPTNFASVLTPKKQEAIQATYRHEDDESASRFYEKAMTESLAEAHRVLKPEGIIAVVYAHKTTLGWSTLVDAMRSARFTITEAWPLATEATGGRKKVNKAMLASSIFLIARKRSSAETGRYETEVLPELLEVVRERVNSLWQLGISGADLVIACVGAGLRAFTRFGHVEYANGERVLAEKFLAEVETAVLETILNRLSKEVGGNGSRQTSLAGLDPATRFYILWRYTYRWTELDAGEAIVFANGTHVELTGQGSLSHGPRALIEKKSSKYRLRDFADRGEDEKLGLPQDGTPAPLIDALHRTLWLMEHRPRNLAEYLREARVNREQMRLVAQALAGPALKGGELSDVSPNAELSALAKLTANWRSLVEEAAMTSAERDARTTGQKRLDFGKESE